MTDHLPAVRRLRDENGLPVELDDETRVIIADFERRKLRAQAPKRMKNAWIALARRFFNPGDQECCRICGKYRVIAQAHHVIPLESQYDNGFAEPDHTHVWLCPNHHEMVHLYLKRTERRMAATNADHDLDDEEWHRVFAVVRMSARGCSE